jgi:uroporphyrinogen-III synthase
MTLNGKRIVTTRDEGQTVELIKGLRAVGATPIIFPTIQIAALDDYTALDDALIRLPHFDWIIFTSINGVQHVFDRLLHLNISPAILRGRKVAAVGPATEAALKQYGIQIALQPEEYESEAIVTELARRGEIAGRHFLLLRVDVSRAVLREKLTAQGAIVEEVAVYRTVLGSPDAAAYGELRAGLDIITFTSSLTVKNFFTLLGDEAREIISHAKVACIGPITANTARELGVKVDIVAEEYTVSGLLKALGELE